MTFVVNLALFVFVQALLGLLGIGIVLSLVPSQQRRYAPLIAPVIGILLLVSCTLLQLDVLHTPMRSGLTVGLLVLVSLGLMVVQRRELKQAWSELDREFWLLLLIPLLYLIVAAATFERDGLHLLQGGQDELLYCSTADHMANVMHTGNPQDTFLPRQDHFLYDWKTREMSYTIAHRHSGGAALGFMTQLTGLYPEEVFPLLAESCVVLFGLALAFLGRTVLGIGIARTLLLQVLSLIAGYLFCLHIQGSLANLLSLSFRILAPALFFWALDKGWRACVLAGLCMAGVIVFYPEPLAVGVLGPIALVWILGIASRRGQGVRALLGPGLIFGSALLVSHISLVPAWHHTWANFETAWTMLFGPPSTSGPDPASPGFWGHGRTILGFLSYHDSSASQARVSAWIEAAPTLRSIYFVLILILGLWGYLRLASASATALAVAMVAWATAMLSFGGSSDYLHFARSFQYLMPLLLVGLVLACFPLGWRDDQGYRRALKLTASLVAVAVTLILAIGNAWATWRTRTAIASSSYSDSLVSRFHRDAQPYTNLREAVQTPGNPPVLISGFKDTVRPHLIVNAIHDRAHVFGRDILSFWPVPDLKMRYSESLFPYRDRRREALFSSFYPLYSAERESDEAALTAMDRDWSAIHSELLEETVKAIVPRQGDYPVDWSQWRDIYPPVRIQIGTLCDVIDRDAKLLSLPEGKVSALQRDEKGIYRVLEGESAITLSSPLERTHWLTIDHDGGGEDLEIMASGLVLESASETLLSGTALTTRVTPESLNGLRLVPRSALKIRAMRWLATEPGR